jgi:transcriptional regulator with XRE-family HTH domain
MKKPPPLNARLAARVAALRAGARMSLDALAERACVSRSMLSLIERGETSPSAVVLEKVATALGTTLASLFDAAPAVAAPVSRAQEREPWRDPESGYVRRNISPPGFPSPIQIVEVSFPAGARVAYETGERDVGVHQQIWVQEGNIEISFDGQTHRLGSGDCLAMELRSPVTFRNRTRKAARYVVVLASERVRGTRK